MKTNPQDFLGVPYRIEQLIPYRYEGSAKFLTKEFMDLLSNPKGVCLQTFTMERAEEKVEIILIKSEHLIVIPPDAPWWTKEACEKFIANNFIIDNS